MRLRYCIYLRMTHYVLGRFITGLTTFGVNILLHIDGNTVFFFDMEYKDHHYFTFVHATLVQILLKRH
jgi:hypothetical protein